MEIDCLNRRMKMNHIRSFFANEIEVQGWLRQQLKLQAEGLSGHLDEIWPDIAQSAWIGKDKEGWERLPYWLDGFIPLAYLLKEEALIKKVQFYIQTIMNRQQEDGWICPCPQQERQNYDLWAVFLICKVLHVYYQCSQDEKVVDVLYAVFKNLYDLFKKNEIYLKHWDQYRYFECFMSLEWLYDLKKEPWMLELASILNEQGIHYEDLLETLKETRTKWNLQTHGVNVAMALKQEAVTHRLLQQPYQDIAEKMWQILMEYHGTPIGIFTCDECLSEKSPIQGSELCSVVELMFSLEMLFEKTKDPKWIDRLEKVAFNALPATLSEDLWTHQYDQMVNQIQCSPFSSRSIFLTNGTEAHLFGLEPNYGCCTANFNQGWPKYACFCFQRCDEGIIHASLTSGHIKTMIQQVPVEVRVTTHYPFSCEIHYEIVTDKEVEFTFYIYIPHWAKEIQFNGEKIKKQPFLKIHKKWEGKQSFTLQLFATFHYQPYDDCLWTLEYGPLVFSLPIESRWEKHEYTFNGVTRKFPYCDYHVYRESDYNYAFVQEKCKLIFDSNTKNPFSFKNPGLLIQTKMQKIQWPYEEGYENVCAKHPLSLSPIGTEEIISLKPYGSCKLRMTAMPLLPQKGNHNN